MLGGSGVLQGQETVDKNKGREVIGPDSPTPERRAKGKHCSTYVLSCQGVESSKILTRTRIDTCDGDNPRQALRLNQEASGIICWMQVVGVVKWWYVERDGCNYPWIGNCDTIYHLGDAG
jgi:hypothetical protein